MKLDRESRILIYGLGTIALIATTSKVSASQTAKGYKSALNDSSRLANQLRTDRDAQLYTASGYKLNLNKSNNLVEQLKSERDMYKLYFQEIWKVNEQLWYHAYSAKMAGNYDVKGEWFRKSYLNKYGVEVVSPNTGNIQIQTIPRWHQEYRNAL